MKIDLATLRDSKTSFDFTIKPSQLDFEGEEVKPVGEIKVSGTLSKKISGIDVEGNIFAEIELDCSRCLESFEKKLEIPFKIGFASEENFAGQIEKELEVEELEISLLEDDEIDFSEIIREQILLAQTAQSFCREDCKGLCSECGQNQNLINCNCKENEVDPRWAALKDIKFNK